MIPGKKYGFDDVLDVALRRKWQVVVPFVFLSTAVVGVVLLLPRQYRAETLIQMLSQGVPDAYVRSTVQQRPDDRLSSIGQEVMTRTELERIILDFDLYAKERQGTVMESVVEGMRKDVTFEIVDREVMRVGYTASSPLLALKVTERLSRLFIEANARDREGQADATQEFLQSELESAQSRLVEQEKRIEQYQLRYTGQLPSQLGPNLQVLNSTQAQLQTLAESLNRDRDQLLYLSRQAAAAANDEVATVPAASPAPTASADPLSIEGGSPREQLEAARNLLHSMELRLTPEHPDVVRTKRMIERLEQKVQSEEGGLQNVQGPRVRTASDVARQNRVDELQAQMELLQRQIASKQAEERRLRDVVADYRGRVDAAPTRESELTALSRDYDTLQKLYASLLAKKEDAQISANLERGEIGDRFKVIEPPRLPERPWSPSRVRLTLVGALAALILSLSLAAFLEFRDSSLRTDRDVLDGLDLQVLAVIPVLPLSGEVRARAGWVMWLAVSVTAVACGVAIALNWPA